MLKLNDRSFCCGHMLMLSNAVIMRVQLGILKYVIPRFPT